MLEIYLKPQIESNVAYRDNWSSFSWINFFTYDSGIGFGGQKRNLDEIDRSNFGTFAKRNLDEIDRSDFDRFVKKRETSDGVNAAHWTQTDLMFMFPSVL